MKLNKLYKLQAELDKTILENEKKRTGKEIDKDLLLNQTILALQVEIAELANETRCFKHWSTKGPNNKVAIPCSLCDGTGDENYHMIMEAAESNMKHEYIECEECGGTGIIGYKNPILEEYTDVLHFYLSLGNQLNIREKKLSTGLDLKVKDNTMTDIFIGLSEEVIKLRDSFARVYNYSKVLASIELLGKVLGFTEEEIEQAYMKKHKENYRRQEEGY